VADERDLTTDKLLIMVRVLVGASRLGEWSSQTLERDTMQLLGTFYACMKLDDFIPVEQLPVGTISRLNERLIEDCVQLAATAIELAVRFEEMRK